jgi:branched-chain amino acid transport system substrate-binding protein
MLSPVGTQSVTNLDHPFFPWVFRTAPRSAITIQAMMQKVVFRPNIKKVAIFYQEDAYGKDEGDLAEAAIKQHGGIEIVAMVSGPMNATDLTAQATRIRNANPDIVLMLTSAPAMGGAFARGAELAGLKAPILGSLSIQQKPFVDAAGKSGEGIMSASLGNWDDPSPKQAELGKILAQGGKQPAGYAEILGSTAIVVLAEALRHIDGPVTGPKIRDALEKICGFSGTYADGTFCYTKDQHDGFGPDTVNFVKLHDGKWENVKF